MAQSLTVFGDISLCFWDRTESNVHFKFATMNIYFLLVNIVKRVLWDVPWTYLIHIVVLEFNFVDRMKCNPSNESY